MAVRFLIPGPLQPFSGGRPAVALDASPATVAEALAALGALYPGLSDRILTEQGDVRPHVNVFVAETNIRDAGGLAGPGARGLRDRDPACRQRGLMRLTAPTPPAWTAAVLADLDAFLLDHAANERKASSSAMALVAHYPDREELVERCIALAIEELQHFGSVQAHIRQRGLTLGPDTRSAYLQRLRKQFREGSDAYFLDRLLTAGIVEARGCERFGLVAAALPPGPLKEFYRELARSEVRHQELYIGLARLYFADDAVAARLEELLDVEAKVMAELPIRASLY